jgi:hypothetical protein
MNDSSANIFESSNLIVCRLSFSLDVIGMIVSVYTVAALTIERYYFIKDKTKIHENDKSKLKIIIIYILLLWTSAICFSMPKTISIHIYGGDDDKECTSSFNETDEKIFTCLKLLIAFAIPYLIIITFSMFLLKFLNEWSKNAKKLTKNSTLIRLTTRLTEITKLTEGNCSNNINNNNNQDIELLTVNNSLNVRNKSNLSISTLNPSLIASKRSSTIQLPNNNKPNRQEIIKKRSTKFVISVVISFLCCWSPLC